MSHQYKILSREDQELVFSSFLIDSWSYSKVQTFARNQKAFEMEYVFGLKGKRSASSVAGNGYHHALAYFFSQFQDGELVPLPKLEEAAFEEIDSVPGNQWKLQKTTPTVEAALKDATGDVVKLLRNFYEERGTYLDDVERIMAVEQYFDEFLTVDGVDIPLPCHGLIDLAFESKNGDIIIVDHKSKDSYTSEDEAAMVTGSQAITYALGFEALTGLRVAEVWFIENKASQNKNGNTQLQPIKIPLNDNNRRLFEHLLYQNLREMLAAVKNPDHVYTINTADKFVDMKELFNFCMRTEICEVEDFNVDPAKTELVKKRLKKIRDAGSGSIPPQIIKNFIEKIASFVKYDLSSTTMTPQEKIEHVLRTFQIQARVAHSFEGYASSTFLLEVGAGVEIKKVTGKHMEIANGLDVPSVRFCKQLEVYEGKSYISMDIENRNRKTLEWIPADRDGIKLPLGRDNYNRVVIWDLDNQSTPHMLVGGATGSGKTVFILSLIDYAIEAGIEEIIILDPKNEFGHLAGPGIDVWTRIEEIEEAMAGCVAEMNRRVERKIQRKTMIIFDEYADAMARARKGKDLASYELVIDGINAKGQPKYKRAQTGEAASLTDNLTSLLQVGRSSGFRIVCAAQRPSTEVIPGDAKANFPVRVAFRLHKKVDSIVVLDEPGAENLTDKGDGLLISPQYRNTIRFQSYFKPETVTA